jgi:carbamoyltransferase
MDAPYERFDQESDLLEMTAQLLAEGKIIGWFSGRMEFGPRALGARSILGDSRSTSMQSTMNLKIKFRGSFRPFAPCVLQNRAAGIFSRCVSRSIQDDARWSGLATSA